MKTTLGTLVFALTLPAFAATSAQIQKIHAPQNALLKSAVKAMNQINVIVQDNGRQEALSDTEVYSTNATVPYLEAAKSVMDQAGCDDIRELDRFSLPAVKSAALDASGAKEEWLSQRRKNWAEHEVDSFLPQLISTRSEDDFEFYSGTGMDANHYDIYCFAVYDRQTAEIVVLTSQEAE